MKAPINSVLEKKLEELESLLEVITFNDDVRNVRKIQLGVLFARTLLTAEISSRQMDVEGEEYVEERFRCMAQRLTEIEAFITNQLPGHKNGSLIEPDKMGSSESNSDIINGETGSVHSLVESPLNESSKGEEEEEEEEEEADQWPLFQDASLEEKREAKQWPLFQDASSEDKREVTSPAVATVKEEVVDRQVKEKGRVCLRALVCLGLIGLVGGIMSIVGYISDSMEEDKFFLTPT